LNSSDPKDGVSPTTPLAASSYTKQRASSVAQRAGSAHSSSVSVTFSRSGATTSSAPTCSPSTTSVAARLSALPPKYVSDGNGTVDSTSFATCSRMAVSLSSGISVRSSVPCGSTVGAHVVSVEPAQSSSVPYTLAYSPTGQSARSGCSPWRWCGIVTNADGEPDAVT
jgi:hypothetical protein